MIAFPPPLLVVADDGTHLATYSVGEEDAPTVLAVHGFASNAVLNWETAGWLRTLSRAGYRVVALDQRGHGASEKPHRPDAYGVDAMVADIVRVIESYDLIAPHYLGYSLGARLGWVLGLEHPELVATLSLGGLSVGEALRHFDADAARARVAGGGEIDDSFTRAFIGMAEGVRGNDLAALVAVADGVRGGTHPETGRHPAVPTLLVTGDADPIASGGARLAEEAGARFVSVPGRDHTSTVPARAFKDAVLEFLAEH
ncbi:MULTISPECIES: alpha/beta fold hydrolase [unclassified Rathayibacter]|uniref:alpha/beta fold hydrolase n=1 Tax=unclassified Rathayibacter TaxID=2609250 RepID=UPI00188A980D|nr:MULTISPECIES: alpha/beta hydrolase [unclassified Rathayibacter]MBF4463534.1 alpha/beta fold hydrolase [Rathayibacter sp. VKM Ac-2879]MBF4505016.1 alpha/beta fold hydrolase [Rathayibacter sp. VKM Ac-2878]